MPFGAGANRKRGPQSTLVGGRQMRHILIVAVALAMVGIGPANAQIVVHDSATTARNTQTAVVQELIVTTQQQQHERFRRMATRLSAHTRLDRYVPANAPLWPGA